MSKFYFHTFHREKKNTFIQVSMLTARCRRIFSITVIYSLLEQIVNNNSVICFYSVIILYSISPMFPQIILMLVNGLDSRPITIYCNYRPVFQMEI